MHSGIDIAGAIGSPVKAAAAGTIEFAGWTSGGYGNLIEIHHINGSMTRYAHLDRVLVQQGDCVSQGQVIGEMGSTAIKLAVTRLHTLLSSAAFCGGSPTQNKQYSLIYTHTS
jgi:murein DD-endopeptidase MepM/ murein hydrolase activator NlpD